ncbi:unnamed protein product [Prunus armeniaca]|uniref:SMC hinge domain-containing protein n=1 Tax=Prunus armeniaca TaxID=36596 RepID=A0A6J5V4G5_PRUAR|nr:unnamed protein product [Prunus armeniaca]
MYIKQVIIEGFKSYREQVATEAFSPKVNCVVGANGSGKTNFFHAIRFVLSDLFQNLRSEDRHALLHEGAGHQVLSAFVEIVFDNADNRIPVDKEEVRLRRTIGLKKDEYFLDGKHITKTEVMNLLESAGFSRSNPYYVVQQGKIASLTLMKDSERLDLLKEIGGTRVYEERRRESLKIMQETGNKRRQIIQVVQYLDERLKELDEEKEELRKYQQLDKQRKSLEYTIYDKELQDARQKLAEVEDARNKVSETSTKMYNSVLDAHEKSIKKHTELELDVKDLQEKISGNFGAKVIFKLCPLQRGRCVRQLQTLQKEIQDSMDELEKMNPLYEDQVMKEKEITKGIMEREKQLSILYQKQGRATQFSSKAARDKWLQKEIDDLERVLSSNLAQEQKLQDEIKRLNTELSERDAYIESRRREIATIESLISHHMQGSIIISQRGTSCRMSASMSLLSLWRNETELSAEIEKLRTEVEKAEKSLDHATPGDVRRGLNSVRKICREYKIPGVFGPIIELLDCDEKFFTAVEVTAGNSCSLMISVLLNSLFHVVVENDEISTHIMLYIDKWFKVGFECLLKWVHLKIMLGVMAYYMSVSMLQLVVFARTVVCRDLDVATKVARTDGLDCITLEGDQVSKKGDLVTEQQKIDAKRAHDKSELEQLKQDIANADKQKILISKALGNKLRASMAMKRAEMGTDLIDHLTPVEKDLLSRFKP